MHNIALHFLVSQNYHYVSHCSIYILHVDAKHYCLMTQTEKNSWFNSKQPSVAKELLVICITC